MKLSLNLLSAWLLVTAAFLAPEAIAQVPKHPPGSICFTPKFWCWASPTGKAGNPCSCPTPYGPVRGTLG
jgi:hypothetical protein